MSTQINLVQIFEDHARSTLSQHPQLLYRWDTISHGRGRRLTILKRDDSGFDVVAEAHSYGLYARAGEWMGPAWDACEPHETAKDLCVQFMDYILSLLSDDGRLEIDYAGARPFRWVVVSRLEKPHPTHALLFNYFAKRTRRVFQNRQLSSHQASKSQTKL